MKKTFKLFALLISIAAIAAGCGKGSTAEDKRSEINKQGVVVCDWFENEDVDQSFKLDKISFSKDDTTALLSYVTKVQAKTLDDYYCIYAATLDGNTYTTPKKVKFEDEYYVISAYICNSGEQIVFTGIPSEQAKDASGFDHGCNLYIGDYKDNKVSNTKQLDFGEDGLRYYIVSVLEDNSILYNSYNATSDTYVSKYAKNTNGEYTVSNLTNDSIDGYYWKSTYVIGNKAFIWRANQQDKSFMALLGDFSDGNLSNLSELSADFMSSKNYKNYYSATGYDTSGGIYYYEMDTSNTVLTMYRSQIDGFKNGD